MKKYFIFLVMFIFMGYVQAVELPDFSKLAEDQGNTVVNITSVKNTPTNQNAAPFPYDEHLQEFFERFGIPGFPGMPPGAQPQEKQAMATGSGFIVNEKGIVITNAHVVNGADAITVKLNDQREFQAELLGIDRRTDVAVLKIKAEQLPKVKIGDPKKLKVAGFDVGHDSSSACRGTATSQKKL